MPRVPVVLVVDDEAPIREVIRRYLVAEGYQVVEAADGEAVMAALPTRRWDLLLLDIMMP
ncbi:MAG TPA: DNA-binding response regulator, partial [Chloroflexi bacterium]|nr:DNA-binding response regulator [Chloroflexota bacterium]